MNGDRLMGIWTLISSPSASLGAMTSLELLELAYSISISRNESMSSSDLAKMRRGFLDSISWSESSAFSPQWLGIDSVEPPLSCLFALMMSPSSRPKQSCFYFHVLTPPSGVVFRR